MNFQCYYHRSSDNHLNDEKFKNDYNEITSAIKSITDKELIDGFREDKNNRQGAKSLSTTLNSLLRKKLTILGWKKEAKLFKDQNYLVNQDTKRRTNSWRLDFAKNNISIEVGFNHGEAIAHNMMKTVFASEMNHIEKDIQTELGVVITATNNLKKAGNFDGAIGSFDKHISYFKAYYNYMPTPIVLIGLNEPESFYIDKKTREVVNL